MRRYVHLASALLAFAALMSLVIGLVQAGNKSGRFVTGSRFATSPVVVRAAGRGNPYINLADGVELAAEYIGAPKAQRLMADGRAEPRALASADFDEDGVPDLVCGYAHTGGGLITLYLGNVDSIFENSLEAQRRKAQSMFTDSAFLSPARVFQAPIAADFVGAGDFDADGHWDLVIAASGKNELYLLLGDGKGSFLLPRKIALPGSVSSLITGEINRADGLTDVVVGIVADDGPKAVVFEGPEGALRARPEFFSLPGEPKALALGQFDDDYPMDLVVGGGSWLVIVHGRDRKLSLDETRRAEVLPAQVDQQSLSLEINSIVCGDFTGSNQNSLALLALDGTVYVVSTKGPEISQKSKQKRGRAVNVELIGQWPGATQLVCAQVSTGPADDLILMNKDRRELQILKTGLVGGKASSLSSTVKVSTSLDMEGEPLAVLTARLNADALSDLVILQTGHSSPAIVKTAAATVFTVNTTDDHDDGVCDAADCTWKEALRSANVNPGADTIAFNVPGPGVHTFAPAFPAGTGDPVTIDGTTQPGFAGTPVIELSGTNAPDGVDGLPIIGGRTTVMGLVINRFKRSGIRLSVTGEDIIAGNYIGTDVTGMVSLPNVGDGVFIDGTTDNTIGGTTLASRNVISGNVNGIELSASGARQNLVQGNYIGTNAAGTMAVGNSSRGISSISGRNNTIGGTTSGSRNVISGNGGGIELQGGSAMGNLVQGNFVGTDASGQGALGTQPVGIKLADASNNTIGGTSVGAGNTIAFNTGSGILLDAVSPVAGNSIRHNSIFSNGLLGIDLRPPSQFSGVTPNDPCDADVGANNLQNFPVLTSATSNAVSSAIQGTLNSTPNTLFILEFFSNNACDPSGFGEGQIFIGSITAMTGGNCDATFNVSLPVVAAGRFITATATDPAGSTSEFSQCIQLQQSSAFDLCLQDESNGNFLLINSTTGEYRFTNCNGVILDGIGTINRRGCLVTLQVNGPDRRVLASVDTCANRGTASVRIFSQGRTFTIMDRDSANNTCTCDAGPT